MKGNIKNKIKNNKTIIIITSFLISLACFICSLSININDYWWHVKAGEYIIKNKTIPFIDVFSWFGINEKLYWHSHEWACEILFYIISPITNSWFWFTLICSMFLLICLYLFNKKYFNKNILFTILWFGLGSFLLKRFLSPRPHMISFILLTFVIYLLFELRNNEHSKKIYFLPIISILWANFHGGSSNLPYILTFLVLGTGLFNFKIGRLVGIKLTHKQQVKLLIVGILSILVLMINPHGLDIITYPYLNMNDSLMLNVINEWRSPDLKQSFDKIYYVIMILPMLILFIRKKDVDFTDFLLLSSFIYLSCRSVRFTILLYILSTFIVCKYMNKIDFKSNSFISKLEEYNEIIQKASLKAIFVMAFFLISFFLYGYLILDTSNSFFEPIVSDEIIEVIKDEEPKRLYNDYDLGGYLIYKDIKVFVDGRADMYSKYNLKDVFLISYYGNQKLIDKYDFDMFLIKKKSAIANYLSIHNNYKKISEDENLILYQKIN